MTATRTEPRAELTVDEQTVLNKVLRYASSQDKGQAFRDMTAQQMRQVFRGRALAGRLIYHLDPSTGDVDGLMVWYKFPANWGKNRTWKDDPEGEELFLAAMVASEQSVRGLMFRQFVWMEPDALWMKKTYWRSAHGKNHSRECTNRQLARMIKWDSSRQQ